jgi:hypothetical protein
MVVLALKWARDFHRLVGKFWAIVRVEANFTEIAQLTLDHELIKFLVIGYTTVHQQMDNRNRTSALS